MALIERIFRNVAAKKLLADFGIAKEIKAGNAGACSDAVILKPALWGMSVDFAGRLVKHLNLQAQ